MKKPSPLPILFIIVFIDLLGFGMVMPLMSRYARELGAPVEYIGLLFTGYSAMQFVFAPLWGRLSDRVGRRPVLLASIVLSAVAFLFSGLARTFLALLLTRLFAGAATANVAIAQAYVADVTTPEDRARGMGIIGAAFGLGFVLGPPVGGLLAGVHLGAPFFGAAGLSLLNGVAAFFILPEPHQRREGAHAPGVRRLEELREAFSRPGFARLLVFYFLVIFAFSAMESTFTLLAADRYGLTDRQVGYVFGFIGVVMVVVQGGLVGRLSRRFGEVPMLGTGAALMVVGLGALPYAGGVPGLLAACVPLAVGQGFAQPAVSSLISRLAAQEAQGGSLGIGQSVAAIGRIVGPETGTYTFKQSMAWPYLGGAAVMLVATVIGWTIKGPGPARSA
ncbi:MFS transporter [Anaeromyxobacter paludicola]|uniref:Tetracycline resistance MFS efflux pump n=1 Tax=Anaeromyxobacter paludicola TaxID=2918171 RepID=A0ABN6N800_9BACT|nr:MFS transporter [Anaeromyxobacter paludicola]BDG09294.1 tetracycline resistance MFS efflux pump [Anaeromyxobacter paludicola]